MSIVHLATKFWPLKQEAGRTCVAAEQKPAAAQKCSLPHPEEVWQACCTAAANNFRGKQQCVALVPTCCAS
eukprot:3451237-Pleurochrysis_carterae.AAC.1